MSVLLVDAEPLAGATTSQALASRGFEVVLAERVDDAIASTGSRQPDAVVLDVADRDDMLVSLAKVRAALALVPVVILAEPGETELAMCSFEMGAVDVVQRPVDIDYLASRIRTVVATSAETPREKTIAELMIPASVYSRIYEDESARRAIQLLTESLFRKSSGKVVTEKAHRSLLVYDRSNAFLGCLRLSDVLELIVPPSSRDTSVPFEPGRFVARCKLLDDITAGELLGEQRFIDIDAPLMEAAHSMVFDGLINIPVLDNGEVVGVLTDRNLLLEICNLTVGGGCRSDQ